MDPTILADAAPALFALAKAALGSAVGAIIGGRLGWLWYRRDRQPQRWRHGS